MSRFWVPATTGVRWEAFFARHALRWGTTVVQTHLALRRGGGVARAIAESCLIMVYWKASRSSGTILICLVPEEAPSDMLTKSTSLSGQEACTLGGEAGNSTQFELLGPSTRPTSNVSWWRLKVIASIIGWAMASTKLAHPGLSSSGVIGSQWTGSNIHESRSCQDSNS
jgi:hypothetical protein